MSNLIAVDSQAHLILPEPLREKIDVSGGGAVVAEETPDGILLRKTTELYSPEQVQEFDEMNERALESAVQGFEERATKMEADIAIAHAHRRVTELESKVGAPCEKEERFQQLSRRQSEIEEKLDLTKNQAPSQVDAASGDENSTKQDRNNAVRPKHRMRAGVY